MRNKVKINNYDYLLIIGFVLAPMTGLRIMKVGPAEVFCLLWCIGYFKRYLRLNMKNFLVRFWLGFLYTIILGALYGIIFYPEELILSQIFTYIFLMIISFGIYVGLKGKELKYIEEMLRKMCVFSSVWYMFLFLYSRVVSGTFLGAPLWYEGRRFTGGGTNPHQIAVLISAVIFISFRLIVKNKDNFKCKVKYIILIWFNLFIGLKTMSSTLIMAIFITGIIGVWFVLINNSQKTKKKKIMVRSMSIILVSMIFIVLFSDILNQIYSWIANDPNGIERLDIFISITESFKKSPIVGLGPGIHGLNGSIEYHNSYLEIIAMSGVIGFSIFIIFTKKIFQLISVDYSLILIILPLYLYGLAGFSMRRLVYWIILIIVIVLAEKIKEQTSFLSFYD